MSAREVSDIYEHDPNAGGDDAFETGRIHHLVPGNHGRMLDPRRTPVTILAVDETRGFFEVLVDAFEDKGARWQLPIEDVSHFQFGRNGSTLAAPDVQRLQAVAARLDRRLEIPASSEDRLQTLDQIERERERIRPVLAGRSALRAIDLAACVAARAGADAASEALAGLLDASGLASLERTFTDTYVSNPHSGEVVKGHAIVIAEMGLCPYGGKAVRDERLFDGQGTREHRRRHIVLRLAFLQELMSLLAIDAVELYRGIATDRPLERRAATPLLAATFSPEVAMAHFQSRAESAVLQRRRVEVPRLFMTFLETPAMNEPYKEAEAVLIGDPGDPAL